MRQGYGAAETPRASNFALPPVIFFIYLLDISPFNLNYSMVETAGIRFAR